MPPKTKMPDVHENAGPTGRRFTAAGKRRFFRLVEEGYTQKEAARIVGCDPTTACRWMKGLRAQGGPAAVRAGFREGDLPDVIPPERLKPEAKRALEDFGYFRRRYFGRISTPWQEDAAYRVVQLLESDEKEYVVVNCPPGSGKSTLFTHDIPAWLICRDRKVRIILFSKTQRKAKDYCLQIRRSLERTIPVRPSDALIQAGEAVDAEGCLPIDYGRFRPEERDLWRTEEFIVAQVDGSTVAEKEPTVSSYGPDSGFLGTRGNLVVGDDIVDLSDTANEEAIRKSRNVFDDLIESRIEPRGLVVLQGQRLHAEDLYRYKLDEVTGETADGAEPDRKYHHVVYRAHDEERCEGLHGRDAPYWPEGCLLDPKRLSWRELSDLRQNKEEKFRVLYQQEDVDPASVLVPPLWVSGGTDPSTGEEYPGCWDTDRGLGEAPKNLAAPVFSIATVDPSPAKFWAIEWWLYQPSTHLRFLVDITRQKMDAPEFLDWLDGAKTFVGLAHEWQQRSRDVGYPITHWVVENNAAQRFLYQHDFFARWARSNRVTLIPHATHRNKTDPELGIEMLKNPYRYGQVRLPGHRIRGRKAALQLVYEVTHYNADSPPSTIDCLMAQWFLEFNLARLARPATAPKRAWRPTWIKTAA